MKIELVTHCLATGLPNYAGALALQISSLLLDQPKHCDVAMTICMNEKDDDTVRVIRHFAKLQHAGLSIQALSMPVGELKRRCIGRNFVARHSTADFVWFTDVDHCFCDGILDRLVRLRWPPIENRTVRQLSSKVPASMIFPGEIMISKSWDLGDDETEGLAQVPSLGRIKKENFIPKGYNRAIGGVQIVQGHFARSYGYLHNQEKWQTPKPTDATFGPCTDDKAYRTFCLGHGPIAKINLPGVYRVRHNQCSHEASKTPEDNRKELARHHQ